MKRPWASIRRLKEHEVRSTLRHIRKAGASWHDIYLRLGEHQKEAVATLVKTSSALAVVCLLIVSFGDSRTVAIKSDWITASVPSAYVCLVGSLLLFATLQRLQVAISIVIVRSRESIAPVLALRGFSANAYGFYYGQDDMALAVPVLTNRFLRERFRTSAFLVVVLIVIYAFIVLPLIGAWLFLFGRQLAVLADAGVIRGIVAASGILVLILTLVYAILFNVPLPMAKDKYSIRWGFLFRLYPKGQHSRSRAWIMDTHK